MTNREKVDHDIDILFASLKKLSAEKFAESSGLIFFILSPPESTCLLRRIETLRREWGSCDGLRFAPRVC